MMNIIDGLNYVKVFLDDMGVLGKGTFDKHINELDEVLTWIEKAGLKLNLTKCTWIVKELKYSGFIAKEKGYMYDPKKIEDLLSMKESKNKKYVYEYLRGVWISTVSFERNAQTC